MGGTYTIKEDNVSSTSAALVENADGTLPDEEESEMKVTNPTASEDLKKNEKNSSRNVFDDLLPKNYESKFPSLIGNEILKEDNKDHNPEISIINTPQENSKETVQKNQNQSKELLRTDTENVCHKTEDSMKI